VPAQAPKVADLGYGRFRQRWSRVCPLVVFQRQQAIDLARVESGEAEIKVRFLEILQLEGQQLLVPVGPGHGSIDHQPESLDLRRRPLVAQDHRDLGDAQLACGLQAQMTIYDLTVAAGEYRDLFVYEAGQSSHSSCHLNDNLAAK
jgi:hypothetical protein